MLQHYQTLFQSLKNTLPGHQTTWIAKLRENALDLFLREGFPTTKDEDWKFTSLRKLEQREFKFESPQASTPSPPAHRTQVGEGSIMSAQPVIPAQAGIQISTKSEFINLVFIDGLFSYENSDELPTDVQLIAHCLDQQPEILESFWGNLDPSLRWDDKLRRDDNIKGYEAFRSLNTAFMQNGAFIRVPKGQSLKIHLQFLTTQTQTTEAAYWRNIIVLEENARATVIESYADIPTAFQAETRRKRGRGAECTNTHMSTETSLQQSLSLKGEGYSYLTNTITEIFLDKSAHLTHYKWQNESHQAFHFGKIYVHQNFEASQFDNHTVSLGGQLSRSDIHVTLKAPKTRCLLNGLYRLSNIQHMDHQTTIDHQTPNATSQELYKGIMDEQSHGVFNGKVLVQKDAQKTVSEQHNHNLLLSLDAQINTKPQLEILADDVKCAHGATVGQLDETAMFYLRSRGLDEKIARQTLIQAFFTDVLDNMPDEFFKEQVKQCL